jgi:hypothetical protein
MGSGTFTIKGVLYQIIKRYNTQAAAKKAASKIKDGLVAWIGGTFKPWAVCTRKSFEAPDYFYR